MKQLKKVVLVPDSFKGSLTAKEACAAMEAGIRSVFPAAEVVSLPVADGGEGSVEAFLTALGGERVAVTVTGPLGTPVEGFYGLLPDGTAVIEMAAAAGLPLVGGQKDPERATTCGVGELLLHAARRGAGRVVLCLGGSATNDGGCGMAAACGIQFLDAAGEPFVPVGGTLQTIQKVIISGKSELLKNLPIVTMCDIDNPLCGPRGAAAVFAPQKGADGAMVERLEQGLWHLSEILKQQGIDVADLPGAGAAGGMGAGMAAFFGSPLRPGIETVLDTVRFEEQCRGADLILTGEGRLDSQSLRGKVISGVARRAGGVPVVALAGDTAEVPPEIYDLGVTAVFSISHQAAPLEAVRDRAARDLQDTTENLMRLILA